MAMPTYSVFLWHDWVHSTLASARLHFWRLSFSIEYDLDGILDTLEAAFRHFGIESYVAYEVLGSYDILLRIWVPQKHDFDDLTAEFELRLSRFGPWTTEFMVVTKTERHWVWSDTTTEDVSNPPTPEDLLLVRNQEIEQLDQYNTTVLEARAYTGEACTPDLPEFVAEFQDKNLLRPVDLDEDDGVRFFIIFDKPSRPLSRSQRNDAVTKILDVCHEVLTDSQTSHELQRLPQLSLYSGYGPMTDFLILARSPTDSTFYEFVRGLIFGLRAKQLGDLYRIRPYTYVFADRHLARLREHPVSAEPPVDRDLIDDPESITLEFKASYGTDLRRFIRSKEYNFNQNLVDAIVRTVCGFLNSKLGGTLLIGVLELERELGKQRNPEEYLEGLRQLAEDIPDADIDGTTKAVVGMEFEYQSGGPVSDWEAFQQHFDETIRERIFPLSLQFISLERLDLHGRSVAAVSIRPVTTHWFHATAGDKEHFFVREHASTRSYNTEEAELWKKAAPRQFSHGG